jgi:hypothetical protein
VLAVVAAAGSALLWHQVSCAEDMVRGAQAAMGIMPLKLTLVGLLWGLGEVVIATLVGAKLYTETT